MRKPFHVQLRRLILSAFTAPSAAPDSVAAMLSKAVYRPCGQIDGEYIGRILKERGIERLVHFTPLSNVQAIRKYGLIPREYLALEVLMLSLGPRFTDEVRYDGIPYCSCFSISSPNYRMFYSKRQQNERSRWAVIEFPASILTRYWALYCPTNAASRAEAGSGGDGIRAQFLMDELRAQLGLADHQTTDPQAEILCDSIIGGEHIVRICVETIRDAEELASKGIAAEVDVRPFGPRHDYEFWKGRRVTNVPGFQEELMALRVG